jgi:AcrR family transcriptional regulator
VASKTERRIAEAAVRLFAERGTTDVTISELAEEAGIARGTLYRNVESIERLFDKVKLDIAVQLHETNVAVMNGAGITDPPARLAAGTRMVVRHAHENPSLGRFMVRFAMTDEVLRDLLSGPPMQDIKRGIELGRYQVTPGSELSIAALLLGTDMAAVWMVLDGHQGWREAGTGAAELQLRALGIDAAEARDLATRPLPDSPPL